MRNALILLTGLALNAQAAAAQTESPDAVVKRLFNAMRAQDTTGMRATFHPDMRLIGTGATPQGVLRAQVVPVEAWLKGIAGAPAAPDEQLFDIEVRTDGRLATVWTRYDFFLGDKFSHCGYDAFQLIQEQGQWKIYSGGDTQRRDLARCGRGTAPVPDPALTGADTAAVLKPIQDLFDAMVTRDTVTMKSVFIPQGRMMAINAQGQRVSTAAESSAQVAAVPAATALRERMFNPEVRINDNLATVWTFYDFYLGDQFSHCGIDYAQLARTADGWKIAQLSYTTRREGCERVKK